MNFDGFRLRGTVAQVLWRCVQPVVHCTASLYDVRTCCVVTLGQIWSFREAATPQSEPNRNHSSMLPVLCVDSSPNYLKHKHARTHTHTHVQSTFVPVYIYVKIDLLY